MFYRRNRRADEVRWGSGSLGSSGRGAPAASNERQRPVVTYKDTCHGLQQHQKGRLPGSHLHEVGHITRGHHQQTCGRRANQASEQHQQQRSGRVSAAME
jgi:hypothetical protein